VFVGIVFGVGFIHGPMDSGLWLPGHTGVFGIVDGNHVGRNHSF
jgi:hypothetical protein